MYCYCGGLIQDKRGLNVMVPHMLEGGEEHEMEAQDLIKRVAGYDEDLARDSQNELHNDAGFRS